MKRFALIAACAACTAGFAAPSFAAPPHDYQISYAGDTRMSCGEISGEIVKLERDIIKAYESLQDSNVTDTSVSVARTVGTFLVGSMGGALGIMAAGHLIGGANDDDIEAVAVRQDLAKQRRGLLMGIYAMKGCQGPLPFTLQAMMRNSGEMDDKQAASIMPAAGTASAASPKTKVFND